jgi:ankyrin repeat protein
MGHAAIVKLLLAASADTSLKDKHRWSAFRYAATDAGGETLSAFISTGADIYRGDENGETPLMWATRNPHNDAFERLLDPGADVNAKTKQGQTALIFAASFLDYSKVGLLLRKGADVNARDVKGSTPLMHAAISVGGRMPDCGNNNYELKMAMAGTLVKAMIAAGAGVNAKNNEGETALMFAAASGQTDVVTALLGAGADARSTNVKGQTALAYAKALSKEPRRDITRLLQDAMKH